MYHRFYDHTMSRVDLGCVLVRCRLVHIIGFKTTSFELRFADLLNIFQTLNTKPVLINRFLQIFFTESTLHECNHRYDVTLYFSQIRVYQVKIQMRSIGLFTHSPHT